MSIMHKTMIRALLAIVVTAIWMVGAVSAQEADDTTGAAAPVKPKAKSRLAVEEIVVTARKKAENLQDVPISISAFSADGIERRGISSLADVAAFTPGLTFSNLFGEFLPVPVIRGVAPTAIFREPNVAVFIDGVYVAGREGLNASQLDLARIEVLKGPQSTKYGRNAFSGAINYVSARPGDELEGEVKVNAGNYDKRQARVTVAGPLIPDLLTGRIAFGVDEWSGSYSNVLSGLDIGGYQYKTLQSSLWFTPTETLDVQWAVYLSDDEIDDSPRTTHPMNCEDRQDLASLGIVPPLVRDPENPPDGMMENPDYSDGPRPLNFCGSLPALKDNVLAINDQATGEERELLRSSLHINWETGFGTFIALGGFSSTNQRARADSNQTPPGTRNADGSLRPPGTVPFSYAREDGTSGIFPAELTTISTGDETTEWSQEVRFTSPQDLPVRFDVGTYWYSEEAIGGLTDFTARLAGGTGERLPADFAGLFPAPGVIGDAIFGPRFANSPDDVTGTGIVVSNELQIVADDNIKSLAESWSVFSGIEVDVGDRWTFDLGARYTHDRKETRANLDLNIPGHEKHESGSRRFDYWTWRGGVKFELTEDNMIFGSVSNGKKSGGLDLIIGDVVLPNGSTLSTVTVTDYQIEEITSFELGNKGTLWEGRVRYDIALFWNDWTDILIPQLISIDPNTGLEFEQPEGVDLTGGDATTWGVEATVDIAVTELFGREIGDWLINAGGSWTDAEFDDAEIASFRQFPSMWRDTNGDGVGDAVDVSGKELHRQSEWQGNVSLSYSRPVRGDWEFFSRTDWLYTGAQWVGAANQAKLPGYYEFNQRLGFESESIKLELWIENLFDDDTPRAAFRDVTFNNTHLEIPATGLFQDMFPFRMTVSHPNRRAFGVSALIKF